MKRLLLLAAVALLLGMAAAYYLTNSFSFRRWLGQVAGRGELMVLVGQRGIYDTDVARGWQAELFARGAEPEEIEPSAAQAQQKSVLERMIAEARLDRAAQEQAIDPAAINREMNLLRSQFRDEKSWTGALAVAGLSPPQLENEVAGHLRERVWLEKSVAPSLPPNEQEVSVYFAAHPEEFQEPLRLRASHLFLAAPDGYPFEVIETKRALITEISKRLGKGTSFTALVTEFSEDEETKNRAGDLGYFAEDRMLPAVFAAALQLQPGQLSPPIRSRLGFHILRLIEVRPARALSFAEARPEIKTILSNQKRAQTVASTLAGLP